MRYDLNPVINFTKIYFKWNWRCPVNSSGYERGSAPFVVKEIRSQYRISEIHSHDAILDILAEDGAGKLYNLEIQRSETVDHARRTRFLG